MEKKKKSMMKRSLGGLLKARRLEQKLTLQELAEKAGGVYKALVEAQTLQPTTTATSCAVKINQPGADSADGLEGAV